MTARKSYDEIMDNRRNAAFNRDYKQYEKIGRLEDKAEELVGELCREGKTVYYVNTRNGKTKEATRKYDLIDFLVRNRYVI